MSKERPIMEDGDAASGTDHTERVPEPVEEPITTEVDVIHALRSRVVELERELERRERQHERVIARYEELLAEARSKQNDEGVSTWLRSLR